jgi:hypothetical protein
MVAYTGIQGQNILIVSSDPANPVEGQIWYNTTSNLLKGYTYGVASWASGGNMNTARGGMGSSRNGTQTSTVAFGGANPAVSSLSESYNGSAWSGTPSLNTARQGLGGAGASNTSALAFGGEGPPSNLNVNNSESFNGSWTSTPSLNTGRGGVAGTGIQTAALAVGGAETPSYNLSTATEKWNGSSWTTSTALPAGRASTQAFGTDTAAIVASGSLAAGPSLTALSFDGTTWTSISSVNTARTSFAAAGSQTSGLIFGGYTSYPTTTGATETWNGSSWTTSPASLAVPRGEIGGSGTSAAALKFGGGPPSGQSNSTEEWTGAVLETKTITAS